MVINAAPATCPRDLPAPSVSELTAFASTPSAGESSSTLASATATLRASDPTARADDTRSDSDEGSDSDQDADGVEAKARALRKRARDDGDSVVSPIAMNQLTRSRNVAQLRPKKLGLTQISGNSFGNKPVFGHSTFPEISREISQPAAAPRRRGGEFPEISREISLCSGTSR